MRGRFLLGVALAAMTFGAHSASAQEADPADNPATTAQIAPGQDVIGVIDPAGESDWYRMRVEQGMRYHITLEAAPGENEPPLDTVLMVRNADRDQLAFNDDAPETLNSALFFAPRQSGDVFVEARGYSPEASGRYRLRVEAGPAPPDDVGDDASTRASISAGQSVNGALEVEGDRDWFRLNARQGRIYRIALNGNAEGGVALGDPLLRVIGADGEELAVNDDHQDLNSYLEFAPQRNGPVFVVAGGFADAHAGAYMLSVEEDRLPPDEAASDARTRGRIQVGGAVEGALDYAGDHDWYRVRLEEGKTYRFSLLRTGASPLGDPLLTLRDADGDDLARDDDGGGDLNSLLEFTAPDTGAYFLDVGAYNDQATGGYTLRAMAGDIPADASTDISLNANGDYREGVLSPAGDTDWYRLELMQGQTLRISLLSGQTPDALLDPYVTLHGPDGAEAASDDDGGEGLNAWLEFTAPAAGTYFLEARGFDENAQGRYQIAIAGGEIGDGFDSAEPIAIGGEPRISVIGAEGDVDWFAIEMIEGRSYRFNLQGADPSPLADPYLVLYNGQGEQVVADDDGGTGLNAYLSYASPTGGPHFLAVSGYNGQGTGHYALTAIDTEVPGHEYTDESLDANGDDRLNTIEMPGDLDAYRVQLEAGVSYRIEVKAAGQYPMADPYLTLLDENFAPINADDDSGPGMDARLNFTPRTAAIYYIQASGNGGSVGSYEVSISRQ